VCYLELAALTRMSRTNKASGLNKVLEAPPAFPLSSPAPLVCQSWCYIPGALAGGGAERAWTSLYECCPTSSEASAIFGSVTLAIFGSNLLSLGSPFPNQVWHAWQQHEALDHVPGPPTSGRARSREGAACLPGHLGITGS
jgi:hypothetical protein